MTKRSIAILVVLVLSLVNRRHAIRQLTAVEAFESSSAATSGEQAPSSDPRADYFTALSRQP